MNDSVSAPSFVRRELIPERAAPVEIVGVIGFLRARLFNSPTNILLTVACILLLWFTIVPTIKFLLIDAVWTGQDRTACLADKVGHPVGACWPFIEARFTQFVYGFYPEPERWRVNLTFFFGAILLLPLLIPRLPAKGLNASLFFVAFPVVAFFLLHGGGLDGLGITWITGLLSGLASGIGDLGGTLTRAGEATAVIGPVLQLLGHLVALIGTAVSLLVWPLVWLNGHIQSAAQPVWVDFAVTAVIVSLLLFLLGGGVRAGWRMLLGSIATFAAIGLVIAAMGLDRGGFPVVDSGLWGGFLVTMVVAVTGIVTSMPIGIALALGRRSTIPLIRFSSIGFIEIWRGVPLITVLFFATYMLPLFLPGHFKIDGLVRALIGIALFSGAYMAEVIRGGLQAIPRGQSEAANAVGLSGWQTTGLIVLPQALRDSIPGIVNSFIGQFKDTSLVSIVALFDLLGQVHAAFADPVWATPTTLFTGFAFAGMVYFVFCFGMSRYSLFVESRLNAHRK